MQVCLQLHNLRRERTGCLSSRQRTLLLLKLKEPRKAFIYDYQNSQTHYNKLDHQIWSPSDQPGRPTLKTTAQVIISGGRTEKVLGPEALAVAHKWRGGSLGTFQQD